MIKNRAIRRAIPAMIPNIIGSNSRILFLELIFLISPLGGVWFGALFVVLSLGIVESDELVGFSGLLKLGVAL